MLSEGDKKFLERLTEKIRAEQDADEIAEGNFCYWTPARERKDIGVKKEFSNGWIVIRGNIFWPYIQLGNDNDLDSVIREFCMIYGVDESTFDGINTPEGVTQKMNCILELSEEPKYMVVYYRNVLWTDRSAIFFTKEECEKYIEKALAKRTYKETGYYAKRFYAGNSRNLSVLITILTGNDWSEDDSSEAEQ